MTNNIVEQENQTKRKRRKYTKRKTKQKKEQILRNDVKKHITAVALFMLALVFGLSLFEQAGIVGKFINSILIALFGFGRYILPILMISLGVMYFKRMQPVRYILATGGVLMLFLSGLGLLHIFNKPEEMVAVARQGEGGGYIGLAIAFSLVKLIGIIAAVIFLLSFVLIGFMLLFNAPVFNLFYKFKDFLAKRAEEVSRSGGMDEHSGEALTGVKVQRPRMLKQQTSLINSRANGDIGKVTNQDRKLLKSEDTSNDKKKISWWKKMFNKKERNRVKVEKTNDNIKSLEFIDGSMVTEKASNLNRQEGLTKNDGSVLASETKSSFSHHTYSNKYDVGDSNFGEVKNDTERMVNSKKTKVIKKRGNNLASWHPPKASIFAKSQGGSGGTNIEENIQIVQQTLREFNIEVEPSGYNVGPTVTQYTFIPPAGVMLNKIVALQSNLAMALAASAIRIEAPIPGTSLIGIEIPNTQPTMVRLGSLLATEEFVNSDTSLTIVLGEDVNGNTVVAGLEKMPHLLVAGSTNTGKSVCINAILSALIYKNSPADLQLILVDPKRVELSGYNGIPHLLTKVITDMNKVVNTLKWATNEMDARYKLLEEVGSRNIVSFNKKVIAGDTRKVTDLETGEVSEEPLEKMPYIVIVIDELADLMATHGKEVEVLIVRLSQMARAVGIHLILSTQRPDTNVITGTIKNNIPARIAFKVGGNVDSRTILDKPGAEKLLGNGDMLYMGPGYPQPTRIQGPFVSEEETQRLIKFVKKQAKKINFVKDENLKDSLEGQLNEVVVSGDVREGENSGDDELYQQARELVIQANKASVSFLQRRLKIGYNRAARIVDMLEDNGVVGPENGSKPREVLIAGEQIMDVVSGPEDDMEIQEERDKREI